MLLFSLYFTEAFILYWFFYKKNNDILNPFGISCLMWFFSAGVSQLDIGAALPVWSWKTHMVVQVFAIAICCASAFANGDYIFEGYYKECVSRVNGKFLRIVRFVTIIAVICSLLEWNANEFVITLADKGTADVKNDLVTLHGIHYGTVFLPYCALIALHNILYNNSSRKNKIIDCFIIVYTLFEVVFVEVSRGSLLIILLGGFFLIHTKKRLNIKKMVQNAVIVIICMIVIMALRVKNRESIVYNATGTFSWWSPIYLYIVTCFTNLNSLILNGSPYTIAYFSWIKPIIEVLRVDWGIQFHSYEYLFFNAKTIVYNFYHDFGMVGIFVNTFVIYLIVGRIYSRAQYDSRWVLLLAALQKSIYMVGFGNYFTGVFCNTFPFIVLWIAILLSQQGRVRR